MKVVYVCSPLRGNIKKNQELCRKICAKVIKSGKVPVAPHIYITQFLNDDDATERGIGLRSGMELLPRCDELYVFGDYISEGMEKEIKLAKKIGTPIKYFDYEYNEIKK